MTEKEQVSPELPKEGDTKVVDGVTYRYVNSGYTIREYFSHESKKGPGPGWDSRFGLLDNDHALNKFGRTFSLEEVTKTTLLPDTPYFIWEEVE